jgi:chitinase
MNDKPTEWVFTSMAEDAERRGHFIRHALRYLREHQFDGLDIDWEFPGAAERGGRPEDKENFTKLLREFRTAMQDEAAESGKPELLLTIAAPAGNHFAQHLELDKIHESLNFINVMTYDYHGEWEEKTGANAPLKDEVGLDIQETMAMYRAAGTPANKLILGLATYARGWGGVEKAELGAPASKKLEWKPEGGDALTAHEIERLVREGKLKGRWDEATATPFAYDEKTKSLFSYDSERSYTEKLRYLKSEGLGGAMFWAIDLDDYKKGFPLIGLVSRTVRVNSTKSPSQ